MSPHSYSLDMSWPAILAGIGIQVGHVLRRAGLPDDLFARGGGRLETPAFYRFWEALEAEAGNATFPLQIYTSVRSESFSPPIFAALCSPDLLTALRRLSKYKRLVGPMRLNIAADRDKVTVNLVWMDREFKTPPLLAVAELLFLVCLARMGTRSTLRPQRVTVRQLPSDLQAYEEYVGTSIRKGRESTVTFSMRDATIPFLSSNNAMWTLFEPELSRRLAELDQSASTAQRVRATLLEGLPGGHFSMDDVAARLALSKRTLQRRLEDEQTSYQSVLRDTRLALSLHYLERTAVPLGEISFLLGFEEINSFHRAFSEWTGSTPETARRESRQQVPLSTG